MQNDQLLAARTLSEMSDLEREKVFEALIFASREPVPKKDMMLLRGDMLVEQMRWVLISFKIVKSKE